MKKIMVLLFIIFYYCSYLLAQQDSTVDAPKPSRIKSPYKLHEFNVGFTNLFNNRYSFIEDILFLESYDGLYSGEVFFSPFFFEGIGINSTRYGLGYKFHIAKGAFRVYADYGINNNSYMDKEKDKNSTYPAESTIEYSWKSTLFSGRLGYEFIITNNKTDFIFGADAIYQSSKWRYDYQRETIYNSPYSLGATVGNIASANYLAIGAGPFIGLRYHLSEMISISTETRMDFTRFEQKGEGENAMSTWGQYSSSKTSNSSEFSSSGLRTKVSPLGLFSLNVHL